MKYIKTYEINKYKKGMYWKFIIPEDKSLLDVLAWKIGFKVRPTGDKFVWIYKEDGKSFSYSILNPEAYNLELNYQGLFEITPEDIENYEIEQATKKYNL